MTVTAAQIIAEIRNLPPEERTEVIRFAYKLDAERRLTGDELADLAAQMTQCRDAKEAAVVREAVVRGFYETGDDA